MREAHFDLAAFFGYLKNNVRAFPLAFVLNEVKPGVQHVPDDLFSGNEFGYLLLGTVHIRDAVGELGSWSVSIALNFSRPPAANVVNGHEDFFRGLIHRERSGVMMLFHKLLQVGPLRGVCRVRRNENRKLSFKRFGHTCAPTLGDGL